MSSQDDREAFEAHKRDMSLALGEDAEVFRTSTDTLSKLDRYDYAYLWSWLGVPIIQVPADIVTTQEVIWKTKPDIIIETGVARGGSLIFMASLLQIMGNGRVIGVDVDIRAHNRESIEGHILSPRITLIEGASTAEDTLTKVRAEIPPGSRVMVVLDSDHSKSHVLEELRCYSSLVTQGQYLVVADTLLGHMNESQTPTKRSRIWYRGDEPYAALNEFLKESTRFETDKEINGKLVLSSSPGGYLICKG